MTEVLIWVSKIQRISNTQLLIGEPLITTTGIANDNAEFRGKLSAVTSSARTVLGKENLLLRLGVDAEMSWECESDVLPSPGFLMTDSETMQIVFNGSAKLTHISPILRRRLAGTDWKYAGFRFGRLVGVIENTGSGIESVQIVIFGESGDLVDRTCDQRDIHDADDTLAVVELESTAMA